MKTTRNIASILMIASITILHSIILVFSLVYRFTDADEGGYLLVSEKVANGLVPAIDVISHSQPLTYYFYGYWMKIFGFNFYSARSLSAIAILITGILIALFVHKLFNDKYITIAAYLMFVFNFTFLKSAITVKPFALSNLFIFAAFVVLALTYIEKRSQTMFTLFISGLFIGLALGVRQIFLLPFVFFAWIIWLEYRNGFLNTVQKIACFVIAMLIPMLPTLLIVIKVPKRALALWGGINTQVFLGLGSNPDFLTNIYGNTKNWLIYDSLKQVFTIPDIVPLFIMSGLSLIVLKKYLSKEQIAINIFCIGLLASIATLYLTLFSGYVAYMNQVVIYLILLSLPVILFVKNFLFEHRKFLIISIMSTAAIPIILLIAYFNLYNYPLFNIVNMQNVLNPQLVSDLSKNVVEARTDINDIIFDTQGFFAFTAKRNIPKGYEYPTYAGAFWYMMKAPDNAEKYLHIPISKVLDDISNKRYSMIINTHDSQLYANKRSQLLFKNHITGEKSYNDAIKTNYKLLTKRLIKPHNYWVNFWVPNE